MEPVEYLAKCMKIVQDSIKKSSKIELIGEDVCERCQDHTINNEDPKFINDEPVCDSCFNGYVGQDDPREDR